MWLFRITRFFFQISNRLLGLATGAWAWIRHKVLRQPTADLLKFEEAQGFLIEGFDLTPDFQLKATSADDKLKTYSSSHFYFVPGFLSQLILKTQSSRVLSQTKIGDYFTDQMDWVQKELHASCKLSSIHSEDSIYTNAATIWKDLEAIEKDVVVVSHSKGGLDFMHAVIQEPKLRKKVKLWLAIQTPFQGTPVADWFFEKRILKQLMKTVLRQMGGTEESLRNLSTRERRLYMEHHESEIKTILKSVKLLSVATYKARQSGRVNTAFEIFRNQLENEGLQSDGIVPTASMILPGSRFVRLGGIDHGSSIMPDLFSQIDRVEFFKTLLKTGRF